MAIQHRFCIKDKAHSRYIIVYNLQFYLERRTLLGVLSWSNVWPIYI